MTLERCCGRGWIDNKAPTKSTQKHRTQENGERRAAQARRGNGSPGHVIPSRLGWVTGQCVRSDDGPDRPESYQIFKVFVLNDWIRSGQRVRLLGQVTGQNFELQSRFQLRRTPLAAKERRRACVSRRQRSRTPTRLDNK